MALRKQHNLPQPFLHGLAVALAEVDKGIQTTFLPTKSPVCANINNTVPHQQFAIKNGSRPGHWKHGDKGTYKRSHCVRNQWKRVPNELGSRMFQLLHSAIATFKQFKHRRCTLGRGVNALDGATGHDGLARRIWKLECCYGPCVSLRNHQTRALPLWGCQSARGSPWTIFIQ